MFIYKFLQTLCWIPGKIFLPTKVIGKKNLPKNSGAVLICNHQSALDVAILSLNIYKEHNFLGKKELFQKKFKGAFFKSIGGIPIDRENPELSSIKECLRILKNKQRLVVFPEGTRKANNDLQNLKNGAVMFAIKGKVPIVPMWIEKKPKFFRFNTLRIGEPIYFDEYYNKKLSTDDDNKINQLLVEKMSKLKSKQQNI